MLDRTSKRCHIGSVMNAPEHPKYFEEFVAERGGYFTKSLGIRLLAKSPEPDRITGAYGARQMTLIDSIELRQGHKGPVLVKASKKKPIEVISYLYPFGGKQGNIDG